MIGAMIHRLDSWVNQMTGAGTSRDKSAFGSFERDAALNDEQLAALFYHNSISKRIVRTVPRMVQRAGYDYVIKVGGKPDAKAKAAVEAERKRLALDSRLYDAHLWGRLYGGAGLVVVGSGKLNTPLRDDEPGSIKALLTFDRRYLHVVGRSSTLDPSYAQHSVYRLLPQPLMQAPGEKTSSDALTPGVEVHASRVLPFFGDEVDLAESQHVHHWSYSVLQTAYNNLRNADSSIASLGALLLEASTSVFGIQGLIAALSGNGKERILDRMSLNDTAKSVYRSIVLDAEKEKYDRVAVQFSGVADVADRVFQHVAAAAEMPMTVLFGVSPAGLNATGESDLRNFYDRVAEDRTDQIDPKRAWLLRTIATSLGFEDVEVEIKPGALWQMTDTEKAALRLSTAQSDLVYANMLAVEPEAIAIARFGEGSFDPNAAPPVDVKRLERALKPAPLETPAPNVELAPTAYEAVLTKRMVLGMLGQPLVLPDGSPVPDLDKTLSELKAANGGAGGPLGGFGFGGA